MKQTSVVAFHNLDPAQSETECSLILNYLKKRYPLTYSDRELAKFTGLAKNVVWSRRCTLAKKGQIEYAGTQFDRETGNYSQVWRYKKP